MNEVSALIRRMDQSSLYHMRTTNEEVYTALLYAHPVEEHPGGALDPKCRKLWTMHPFPFDDWAMFLPGSDR